MCLELVVLKRAHIATHERDILVAWHTANLSRASILPKFTEYLRAGRPQSPHERDAMWLHIAGTFGLPVRSHDKRKIRIVRG